MHDDDGDPVVVDWRADVSTAFYRATREHPMDVLLRRRFGFERGHITAYEDEHLLDRAETEARSRILAGEIERPRVGPMRDIVATIQPEQDVIVRADVAQTICVQGAPGTGKTAVGLHRAAYLLYTFRDRLRRGGVLVVGPNSAFLSYISAVLPALGEVDVRQVTLDELVGTRVPIRAEEPAEVATLKGDPRMAEVLRRAVYSGLVAPTEPLVLPRGSRRWRLPAYELAELVAGLQARDVRYGAARAMLAQRLAHALLSKMEEAGESPDDRVQDAVARSQPVRRQVDLLWPAVDPVRVVMTLLGDADLLAAAADGVCSRRTSSGCCSGTSRRAAPSRRPGRSPTPCSSTRWPTWSTASRAWATWCWTRRRTSHPCSCARWAAAARPARRRCSATSRRARPRGRRPTGHRPCGTSASRTGTSRCSAAATGCRLPCSTWPAGCCRTWRPASPRPSRCARTQATLDVRRSADPFAAAAGAVADVLAHPGSVGVIVADADVAAVAGRLGVGHVVLGSGDEGAARVAVVPASLAKGLEYDHVVVVEPATIVAAEPSLRQGLRRLYVVLTRAVTGLVVVHGEPLPEELAA